MVTSSSAESSTLVFFVPGIMGSSLFLTRNTPSLHPVFDRAWQMFQKGETRGDLQKALERCYSLYQLLPPPEIITLYDEGGTGYSTLDRNIAFLGLMRYTFIYSLFPVPCSLFPKTIKLCTSQV